jgi:hypothetical protein
MRQWLVLALCLCGAPPAFGQTINFDGTASATCSLAGATNGSLTLGSDLSSWATTTPGTITATNTTQSSLTVTRSGSWSVSPSGTPSTTFAHQISVSGGNTLSDSQFSTSNNAKTGQLTSPGVNLVSISVTGTAASPYPAGSYRTQVTVTCAPN